MSEGKRSGPVVVEFDEPDPFSLEGAPSKRASTRPGGAVVVEYDAANPMPEADPSTAPEIGDEPPPEGRAMVAATRAMAGGGGSWLARTFWASLVGLIGLWAGTAAWDFAFGLLERNLWLGRLALAFGALTLLVAAVFIVRELTALARLGRIDRIRALAAAARRDDDIEQARATTRALARLYEGREDTRWGLDRLRTAAVESMDADALLKTAERDLLGALDTAARAEIETACRQVATVTAIVPLTLADVVVALTANLRMIRRMAAIYGGRAGRLGSWRLMRAVATHLVATGAVGAADDMIGAIAGGGAMAKISRRFGEGVINGALTVRVGLAAMEVCRPLPFAALRRPGTTYVLRTALRGFFNRS